MSQQLAYGAPVGASKKKGLEGVKHIAGTQEWSDIRVDVASVVSGKQAFLQLAGNRENGEANRFCFKHILSKSKKGKTSEETMKGKLMHRIDRGGTKLKTDGNTVKKDARKGEEILNRKVKYGDQTPSQNTVIDLEILPLETVLVEMVKKLVEEDQKGSWARETSSDVEFRFSKTCVKTIDTAYKITDGDTMKVSAYKRKVDFSYEVYHVAT